jgi:hypothetical protein
MPVNYVLLSEITTSVSTASVTFSNIPQTGYTDLKIVMSARLTTAGYDGTPWVVGEIQLNNTPVTSGKLLFGTGSAAGSDGNANAAFIPDTDATANVFGSFDMYLPNYMSSSNKSIVVDVVTENAGTASLQGLQALLSTVAVPVTSIKLLSNLPGLYAENSTFSLYGIAAFGTTPTVLPKATGGDIVVNDGTYWYHAFLSSGIFTPSSNLSCSALVVAGGGGGGNWASGGGGAGGVSYISALSLNSSTNTAVTIGAGGAQNVSGSNSVFGSIISNGGGRGGTNDTPVAGAVGGSGGGGAINGAGGSANQGNTGGATGYGNNGGTSTSAAEPYASAGGGGAGGVGTSVSGGAGGAGGVGITNSTINTLNAFGAATSTGQLSGGNYYYAGGGGGAATGGGAAGGLGGGGAGISSTSVAGTAGTANTGGGGGGQRQAYIGGAGGSGIVIVRYTMA